MGIMLKKRIFILIFFIQFISCNNLNAIKKPQVMIGIKSSQNLKKEIDFDYVYPNSIGDMFYCSIEQKILKIFNIKYLFNITYSQYNKNVSNFSYLKNLNLKNYIYFSFKIPVSSKFNHSLQLKLSPQYYSSAGENYYKMYNSLSYTFSIKNFKMLIQYSNQFSSRDKDSFKHKINFTFYWAFPKYDFIKFKGYLSLYFEHGLYNELDIFPLTKASFKFEVAFDFNKNSFEDIFTHNQQEENIYSD